MCRSGSEESYAEGGSMRLAPLLWIDMVCFSVDSQVCFFVVAGGYLPGFDGHLSQPLLLIAQL